MPTTCSDLLRLKCFQEIRLVAGEHGLYRALSWPYVCFTPTISQWLHGGELIFVVNSGLHPEEQNLEVFMRECIQQNMAGMIILSGGESGLRITPALIQIANEANFPLFEMPWTLKMIDVTQEITQMIVSRREAASRTEHFLEQAYFTADEPHKLEKLSALCGIQLRQYAFTCILQPEAELSLELGERELLNRLSYTINMRRSLPNTELLSMKYLSNVLICGLADTPAAARKLAEQLTEAFRALKLEYPERRLKLAFSQIAPISASLPSSFTEAHRTLDIMDAVLKNHSVLHYYELGILRLFSDLPREKLRAYCMENLAPLIRADQENGSALIPTLRVYLQNNCNLIVTSGELFIHRNTLVYRLKNIRQLLGRDLNDPFVKNELFNSLLMLELLNADG